MPGGNRSGQLKAYNSGALPLRWLLVSLHAMWSILRFVAVLACLASAVPAWGQSTGLPPFPQTLPANTVVGRIGAGQAGPAEAIPFVTLSTQLNALGFGNIAANKVFSGPTTGAATTPAFRALVGADLT